MRIAWALYSEKIAATGKKSGNLPRRSATWPQVDTARSLNAALDARWDAATDCARRRSAHQAFLNPSAARHDAGLLRLELGLGEHPCRLELA